MQSYTLRSEKLEITISRYGGRITHWLVDGVDIILGFDDIESYKTAKEPYHGALIGRYSNRISQSQFAIDDKIYNLKSNLGNHVLHGGPKAFHNQEWDLASSNDKNVTLYLHSPDGDMGFPGDLYTKASYTIEENTLILKMSATSSAPTFCNFTYHPYFNLGGLSSTDLYDHQFRIQSNHILETDKEGIPSGNAIDISGSGFDFTDWQNLQRQINKSHPQMDLLGGIDHNYLINANSIDEVIAEARCQSTGIHMQLSTDQPGLQMYTANHFDGSEFGKSNRQHNHQGAFCFEPQHYPDSPHHKHFPSTLLLPNQEFLFTVKYSFL